MGSNPDEAWIFFRLLFRNCLNCVSTAKIFHNVITHNRGSNLVTIDIKLVGRSSSHGALHAFLFNSMSNLSGFAKLKKKLRLYEVSGSDLFYHVFGSPDGLLHLHNRSPDLSQPIEISLLCRCTYVVGKQQIKTRETPKFVCSQTILPFFLFNNRQNWSVKRAYKQTRVHQQ